MSDRHRPERALRKEAATADTRGAGAATVFGAVGLRAAVSRVGPAALQLRNPLLWSAVFYLTYRLFLVGHLYEGRQLPPANDSFYYIFRISRVMDGVLMNDTSITYTYSLAFLGRLLGLDAIRTFELGYFLAPFLSLAILLYFFHRLAFPQGAAATCLLLLSFYSIGAHTFQHFVPSTLAVLLMLLWFGVTAREPSHRPWLYYAVLGGLSLALAFSHSAGPYVLLANLGIVFGIHLFLSRRRNMVPIIASSLAALAVFVLVTRLVPFETFGGQHAFDRVVAGSVQSLDHLMAGSAGAGRVAAVEDEWSRRVYDAFFFYIAPNVVLGIVNVTVLALLAVHSAFTRRSPVRNGYLLGPLLFYLAAFLIVPFFYKRGVRLVEFVFPFCFMLVGIFLWDLGARSRRWLRAPAVIVVSLGLAFLSYNVTTTENLMFKPLAPFPPEIRRELGQGVTVFRNATEASILLAQGIHATLPMRYILALKEAAGDHHVFELRPCAGESDNPLYQTFRHYFAKTPHLRMNVAATEYGPIPYDRVELRTAHRAECYVIKDIVWN